MQARGGSCSRCSPGGSDASDRDAKSKVSQGLIAELRLEGAPRNRQLPALFRALSCIYNMACHTRPMSPAKPRRSQQSSEIRDVKSRAYRLARRVSDQCLGLRARRLGREVARIYDTALQPLGLTGAQFTLLVALQMLEPVSPGDLGSKLGVEKSTMSRNLKLMAERTWIQITQAGANQYVSIDKAGVELLLRAEGPWKGAQKQVAALVGPHSVELLRAIPATSD